jgi:hypothetical protein
MKLGGEATQSTGIMPRLHSPLRAIDLGRPLQGMRAVGCVLAALLRIYFLWICSAFEVPAGINQNTVLACFTVYEFLKYRRYTI